jgi:hypothetical protein
MPLKVTRASCFPKSVFWESVALKTRFYRPSEFISGMKSSKKFTKKISLTIIRASRMTKDLTALSTSTSKNSSL